MGFYTCSEMCQSTWCDNDRRYSSVSIADQESDVFLEGANITFGCSPGQMLIDPNIVMCMGNGEWEPDLNYRQITCKGALFNPLHEINTTLNVTCSKLWDAYSEEYHQFEI